MRKRGRGGGVQHAWRPPLKISREGVYVVTTCDSLGPVVAQNAEVLVSKPGRVGCSSSRLCTWSAPDCSKAWIVQCCLWYIYEYCFTSLSAQSWQYRDRRKPEAGTMPHPYFEWLEGFFIVHSTICSTVHSMPLNSLEHCIIMNNHDDKYPPRTW